MSLELKKTEARNLLAPLRTYCIEQYGSDKYENIASILKEFNNLRNEICNLKSNYISQEDITHAERYLYLCNLIEKRFSFGSSKNSINVTFSWSDCLIPQTVIALSSIEYEKTCVLYNIAIMYFQLGNRIARQDPEYDKLAIKHCLKAAGIVKFIRQELIVNFDYTSTFDLSSTALQAMQFLFVGMAQELVYEKGAKQKMERNFLAKLASQTAFIYKNVFTLIERTHSKAPKISAERSRSLYNYYMAIANYQFALGMKTEIENKAEGYGVAIARLKLAISYCNESNQNSVQTYCNANHLKKIIQAELTEQEKDNNLIYHELIPKLDTLQEIEKLESAIPIDFSFESLQNDEYCLKSFDELIPKAVRDKVDQYRIKTKEFSTVLHSHVQNVHSKIANFLSVNNLPASLETFNCSAPTDLMNLFQTYKRSDSLKSIIEKCEDIEKLNRKASATIKELQDTLKIEGETALVFTKKHGAFSNFKEASAAYTHLCNTIKSYEKKNTEATDARERVQEGLQRALRNLSALDSTEKEFSESIPSVTLSETLLSQKDEIKHLLGVLGENVKKMIEEITVFEAVIVDNDPCNQLLKECNNNITSGNSHLAAIKLVEEKKNEHIKNNENTHEIFLSVEAAYQNYKDNVNKENPSRVTYISNLKNDLITINEAQTTRIEEGRRFFETILNYLTLLSEQIKSFVAARVVERDAKLIGNPYSPTPNYPHNVYGGQPRRRH